jgi:hypothetical protein
MITESNINDAFDAYLRAFNVLADKEDYLDILKLEVDDFKEGSPKHAEAIRKVREYETQLVTYQRDLRKAALQLDRVKTLAQVQK